jgi:UTP--glucose-1-phosphate uridylyltransferase
MVADYFRKSPQLEKILQDKKQDDLLESLSEAEGLASGLTFSYVSDKPLGDGHAVLQARKLVGDEPCFVIYADDIIEAGEPCASQLTQVFRTAGKPIVGLFEVPREKVSSYGVVAPEKIASRLYKIKGIVEKPTPEAASSRLVITGRSIITPEVFDYLKKARPNKKGEISLTETFGQMVKDGKIIYGYQCEGRWWECGNKEDWLKSFGHFAANHQKFVKEVRKFMKEEKLV